MQLVQRGRFGACPMLRFARATFLCVGQLCARLKLRPYVFSFQHSAHSIYSQPAGCLFSLFSPCPPRCATLPPVPEAAGDLRALPSCAYAH